MKLAPVKTSLKSRSPFLSYSALPFRRGRGWGWGPLLFWLLLPTAIHAQTLIQSNDRLAICGDAMTANLGYAVYIEDYLLACQPVTGINIREFGWSAGTAQAFNARLATDVLPFKPTVVMTCFGRNEGGHTALDPVTAAAYRQAQTNMVEAFKKAGVRAMIVGSPKCVDPLTYGGGSAQATVYNKTLAALAVIDKEVAVKEGVVYADVFGSTMTAMTAAKARYGASFVFDTNDPYHTTDQCSLAIASVFLRALRCSGNLGTVTVDYKNGIATAAPGQKIVSFDDQTVTVASEHYPFSFIGLQNAGIRPDPSIKRILFDENLNRDLLAAKNLPTARAKVLWNNNANDSQDFTATELAKGINLATSFNDTPFNGHFENVNGGVLDQQQEERIAGTAFVQTNGRDASEEAKRDAAVQKAFAGFVPVTHTLRIQPLAPDEKRPPGPVNVIEDTDMSSDCDDVGATALLNSFMDQSEARLIACVVNGRDRDLSSGAVVQAINTYYGHPSIPIGANHGEAWIGTTGSAYTLKVHQQFDPEFPTDDKLPAGVDVYRKALASAADHSVYIASIGLMENLQALIESKPDAISPLSGFDLIHKKVRELVIMGNTNRHDGSVINTWPTKILYTTDVGSVIYTGKSLVGTPDNNPVRFAYELFGVHDAHSMTPFSRQSWDLTAAWLAVRGPCALWDVASGGYRKVNPVTGASPWVNGPATNEGYVMQRMPVPEVTALIEAELSRPPKP